MVPPCSVRNPLAGTVLVPEVRLNLAFASNKIDESPSMTLPTVVVPPLSVTVFPPGEILSRNARSVERDGMPTGLELVLVFQDPLPAKLQ